jgi:PQQ-dependent catabolism-associated CXXCW motif protein
MMKVPPGLLAIGLSAGAMILASAFAGDLRAGEAIPEPSGYRMEAYRAPVPERLSGARTVATEEAEQLWQSGEAIFVDVLPRARKPAGLPEGTFWRDPSHRDIPGSIWLPGTGYGELQPQLQAYLEDALATATGGDVRVPLVFYCLADCWMSWNAAKRALAAGYSNVIWYPDGTDGWEAAGLPLEERTPEPLPDDKAG